MKKPNTKTNSKPTNEAKKLLFTSSEGIEIKSFKEGEKYDTAFIGVPMCGDSSALIFINVKIFSSEKTETELFVAPFSYRNGNEYRDFFTLGKNFRTNLEKAFLEYYAFREENE